MKATGIIRRIDDLGRVVIPKAVRKEYDIKEGDPMEISYNANEKVIELKKYVPVDEVNPKEEKKDMPTNMDYAKDLSSMSEDELKALMNECSNRLAAFATKKQTEAWKKVVLAMCEYAEVSDGTFILSTLYDNKAININNCDFNEIGVIAVEKEEKGYGYE